MGMGFHGGDENVLELEMVMLTQPSDYAKTL